MATLTCGLLPTIYYVYLYHSTISWQFYGVMATLLWLSCCYFQLRQGQGVGSAALATVLQETDALGLAVFLTTQEDSPRAWP